MIHGSVGTWRSLVAHLHGVQGVPSSNLGVPTNFLESFASGNSDGLSGNSAIEAINAMKSKLAEQARQDLIADTQRLSPEERLNAFLEHAS